MHVSFPLWFCRGLCLTILLSTTSLLAAEAPVAKPTTIVMLGSSTTAPREGIFMVYAERVRHALAAAGNSVRVINAGVPGDTTEKARERFEKDVLDHHPDLVVIQLGGNDAAMDVWKTPPVTQPRVSEKRFEENLRWMIDKARAAGSKVLLMTTNQFRWTPKLKTLYGKSPYDPNDPEGFTNASLRDYNKIVRALANEKNLPLTDVLQAYDDYTSKTGKNPNTLLLDGMHPNDSGHELVADLLLPEIFDTLALKRSPVKEVLALPPSKENPRNSEGDFIRLKDGRILFVYTHFTGGGGDHSKAHLAGRFSSDDGKTWTDEDVVVIPYAGGLNVMSVSLLRLQDGRIALFYAKKTAVTDCRPIMRISDDEAKTWSDPIVCVPDSRRRLLCFEQRPSRPTQKRSNYPAPGAAPPARLGQTGLGRTYRLLLQRRYRKKLEAKQVEAGDKHSGWKTGYHTGARRGRTEGRPRDDVRPHARGSAIRCLFLRTGAIHGAN